MALLCSLQPKLEIKNSVVPFTVVVSTCGTIIVWLRHCFLYLYVQSILSLEKEGNNDVSTARGSKKEKQSIVNVHLSAAWAGPHFKSP